MQETRKTETRNWSITA